MKRVGHQHRPLVAVVAAQHDEVAGGHAADVVGMQFGPYSRRVAVQVGRAEAGEDRDAAGQVLADQLAWSGPPSGSARRSRGTPDSRCVATCSLGESLTAIWAASRSARSGPSGANQVGSNTCRL